LDFKKFEAIVSEFNTAVNNRGFDLMSLDGKATFGLSPKKTNWANTTSKPPYFGVPRTSHLTFTYGSLKVDLDSRVLSTNGVSIPGLYAAGELTGPFYHEYLLVTSCLRSMAFGREAGMTTAKKLSNGLQAGQANGKL
jgi:tricarballylate dehydrogenase